MHISITCDIKSIKSKYIMYSRFFQFEFQEADFGIDFYTNRITQHIGRDHCNLSHVFV